MLCCRLKRVELQRCSLQPGDTCFAGGLAESCKQSGADAGLVAAVDAEPVAGSSYWVPLASTRMLGFSRCSSFAAEAVVADSSAHSLAKAGLGSSTKL